MSQAMKNMKFLVCVIEHAFVDIEMVHPGSPVLIVSEILTMVVRGNKVKSSLGFFEIL